VTDDWGYINARLKGMKSLLLGPSAYEALLSAKDLEEVVRLLDSTALGASLAAALSARQGIAGVDEGLRRDFQAALAKMVRLGSGHPRELILLVMGRWELLNVKTVLRGKHLNAPVDAVLAGTLPFGRLDEAGLGELTTQRDMKGVIDLLVQWGIPYARDLAAAFPAYREKLDLQALETSLDKAWFARTLRDLDNEDPDDVLVKELVRREIDGILIGYALRVVHYRLHDADNIELFIPGGREIDARRFGAMLNARTVDELIRAVEAPGLTECLEAAVPRYLENNHLSGLERSLETCFARKASGFLNRDPLSIGVAIGYLWLKVNEIINVRIIARGTHANMPREEIDKQLVYP
jgi:V/A-type H+-transporting ATPase subunit C